MGSFCNEFVTNTDWNEDAIYCIMKYVVLFLRQIRHYKQNAQVPVARIEICM